MAAQDTVGAIASLKITGASSYFTAKVLTLDFGESIPSISRTPLDRVTGGHTFEPGRLKTWTMNGTMIFAATNVPPVGTKGAVALVFADATGSSYTWPTGFLMENNASIALEEGIEASWTIQLCGTPAFT